MPMAAPAKYLFDTDFARGSESKPSTIALADHTAKVKEAEAAAFARGFAAAEAKTAAEARSAAALERVVAAIEAVDRGLSAIAAQLESEAVGVAVAVGR